MLNQIILGCAIHTNVSQHLTNDVQLVITGEDNCLFDLFLSCEFVFAFLNLQENELVNKVKDSIFFQNVIPHVGHAVAIFECRIALTGVYTFAVAHIEGQEESRLTIQLGGHIDLVEIHCEIDKAAGLEQEQSCFRVAFGTILINRILIGLACHIALEFKGHDGKAVQEDHKVNALFVACPHFLHNREDVLFVFLQ